MEYYQQKVEDPGVTQESSEDEEHAGQHPGGDGTHALHVWRIVVDGVEDVDQHQKKGDEKSHSS